ILNALRSGSFPAPAPMTIQTLNGFRDFWLAIGDTSSLYIHLLAAAEGWLSLGINARAEALYREANSQPAHMPDALRSYSQIVRGDLALSDGRLAEALEAFADAEAGFAAAGNEAGLLLVSAGRALAQTVAGEGQGAAIELDRLMAHPIVRQHSD